LSDWATQRWVQYTGRSIDLREMPWLEGPIGRTTGIGKRYFEDLARESHLEIRRGQAATGLVGDFRSLAGPGFDPGAVRPPVAAFYERTSDYALDAWAEWCGLFRPFGRLLAFLFSRRLQQLNVPLTGLDTSQGVTSEVLQLVDPKNGTVRYTAWLRELLGTGDVLYAGSYSTCTVPGYAGTCVKVVFPLPNGNAIVIMKPEAHPDGSFSISSTGSGFGDPGFYFTVHGRDRTWARYVRSLRESIKVYASADHRVRADHVLTIWGATFLRLHYRLEVKHAQAVSSAT
jgi:hypothetical protein